MATRTATIFVPWHALDEAIAESEPAPHAATHAPDGTDVLPVSAASRLLGRGDAGAGALQEISLSGSFLMAGTTLSVRSGIFNYTYNSTLLEPPTAGQLRMNAAHPYTAVTKLWMRTVSADGQDLFWGLMIVPVGATILVQDKDDHTRYGRFETTDVPIDKGVYVEMPVVWVANGTAIVTAQAVFVQSTGGAPPALAAHVAALEARLQALEKRSR